MKNDPTFPDQESVIREEIDREIIDGLRVEEQNQKSLAEFRYHFGEKLADASTELRHKELLQFFYDMMDRHNQSDEGELYVLLEETAKGYWEELERKEAEKQEKLSKLYSLYSS